MHQKDEFLNQVNQYARWMAGCRLAAKGKTLANVSYDSEVKSIQAFLSMQHPATQPVINPLTLDIQIEDYVAQRFLRKPKSKVSLSQLPKLNIPAGSCLLMTRRYGSEYRPFETKVVCFIPYYCSLYKNQSPFEASRVSNTSILT